VISSSPRADGFSEAAIFQHAVVVEVEADDGEVRARPARLLFETDHAARGVELDDAVSFRIAHAVAEDGGSALARRGAAQALGQAVAVEQVVAQGQGHTAAAHEIGPDEEGLRNPLGTLLGRVAQGEAEPMAVPQDAPEARLVLRRRDEQDLTDVASISVDSG